MRGIFLESLRGAIVRILRLIIYLVIILLICYIVGLINEKKYEKKGNFINASEIEEKF